MDKVKEELKYLETGTKPELVSSPNIGALQVCATTHVQRFDFVDFVLHKFSFRQKVKSVVNVCLKIVNSCDIIS